MDSGPIVPTILPHSNFGDPDCCGRLYGLVRDDQADIRCNECNGLIRTVPTAELETTFREMELTLDIATEKCPHCGSLTVLTDFSKLHTFVCRNCQKPVTLSDAS